MKLRRVLAAAVVTGLLVPVAAMAQNYRFDLGINGGGSWLTSGLGEDQLMMDADVRFEPGWLTGAQATAWLTPRIGLRANFGYSDRGLEFDAGSDIVDDDIGDGVDLVDNINLWTGTGDLMIRFAGTPMDRFQRPEFLPFIALGAGARWINPAGEGVAVADTDVGDDESTGAVFTVGDNSFFIEEQSTLLGRVALGTDIRVSPTLGFRLELGDMMWDAPFERVEQTADGGFERIEPDGEDVGNTQHELYATAGIHLMLGLMEPAQRVAALPAPPPPAPAPEPAPEPEPEPEVVEEAVTVCVIDPAAPGGTRMMDAVFLPASGDTMIEQTGQRIALDQYDAGVRIAMDEDWYRTGQGLELEYGADRVEFIAYGADRPVEADLVVLGSVDGLPVYADADAAMTFRDAAGNSLTPDTDLEVLLADRPELHDAFGTIDVLYVPARPVGCVFGPLQRVEDVRKN